jgi:hypothetical protein
MTTVTFDRSRKQLLIPAIGIASAAAFFSCTPGHDQPAAPLTPLDMPPPTTQALGAHWIHNQALKQVMAQLYANNPSWPSGMPQDPESAKVGSAADYDKIESLADELALSADQLPTVAEKLTMNEADRAGFLAEANVLHEQARRLSEAARSHHVEQMQRHMTAISYSCISCHSRYRDFSGQLDSSYIAVSPDRRAR